MTVAATFEAAAGSAAGIAAGIAAVGAGEPDLAIDRTLALGDRLLAVALSWAAQLDLEAIDLPPVLGAEPDQARLRAIAPLYLAAELESARLLPAVETLAAMVVTGALRADIGDAAPRLVAFWKRRRERLSAEEREAFFGRVFGKRYGPVLAEEGGDATRNEAFEPLMTQLALALTEAAPDPRFGTTPADDVRVRVAAGQLAANLIPRGGGMAVVAARDATIAIREAIAIVSDSRVQRAVGARSSWDAVAIVARRYLRQQPDIASRVTRGKAGTLLLAWLAESLPTLDEPAAPELERDDAAAAAAQWLGATGTLDARARGMRAAPSALALVGGGRVER